MAQLLAMASLNCDYPTEKFMVDLCTLSAAFSRSITAWASSSLYSPEPSYIRSNSFEVHALRDPKED